MKEFSKEIIEIDGQEYTLFLNREGIVAWEKFCKKEQKEVEKLQEKYKNIVGDETVSITEDTNPFEGIEDIDNDAETISIMYERLYWIMLYTEHKFTPTQAKELYDKAIAEYGEEQIILLGNQMIEEANKDSVNKKNLKNLAALKSKK